MFQDGQRLGEFEILDRLGQGGMGAVYKARQVSLKRFVALKTLQASLASDPEYIARFHREAIAAASLNHPNLVQVYSAGETDGLHWFAMEYVEGESAQARVKRKERLDPAEAIAIGIHIATALEYGWRKAQLIHRDIKPDNIFLSSDGEVKLGDLGLAKSLGETLSLTTTGAAVGTPHYVSPEQGEGKKDVDLRADIYSLGCTLFHLVAGKPPYGGDTALAVMMKHVTAPIPNPQHVWPGFPAELARVVMKMMAKSPSARQQTYAEVLTDLRRAYDAITTATVPQVIPVSEQRQPPPPRPPPKPVRVADPSAPTVIFHAPDAPSAGTASDAIPKAPSEAKRDAAAKMGRSRMLAALLPGLAAVAVILAIVAFFATRKKDPQPSEAGRAEKVSPDPADGTRVVAPHGFPAPAVTFPASILTDPDYEWSAPVNLGPGVNTAHSESRPTVTDDELILIFSAREHLWESRRTSVDESFGQAVMIDKLKTDGFDKWAMISGDGLTLVYCGSRGPGQLGGNSNLYETRRVNRDAPWSEPVNLGEPINGVTINAEDPWLSADGLTLFFSSNRGSPANGVDINIWRSRRTAVGQRFGKPERLGASVNTTLNERFPQVLSPDGDLLFVRENPDGINELLIASSDPASTRAARQIPVSVKGKIWMPWLSRDGRTLYFASSLATGPAADLWEIHRIRKANPAGNSITPAAATKDAPFVNSLGMKFVPVAGTKVLFSIWDTRVQDYAEFVQAQKALGKTVDGAWAWQTNAAVPVGREAEHPVVSVSWDDAQVFCAWLTEKERAEGKVPPGHRYRLPTDEEWSAAVGLPPEQGATPEEKNRRGAQSSVFPWGNEWPPTTKAGNYADETFHASFPPNANAKEEWDKNQEWLAGYTDGFATTSPVGSFPANRHGLHDMGGNVWQWCEDWWSSDHKDRVLRGASWTAADRYGLRSSARSHGGPTFRRNSYGFRCVLEPAPSEAASITPATATKDAPFVNSLGMKFVPVPITGGPTDKQRVLFSAWETRVQDFDTFASTSGRAWKKTSTAEQSPLHPAVDVSWEDATAFCAWLTERERKAGTIGEAQAYRLPSDHEWSCAAGVGDREDTGKTPKEKSGRIANVYPWGAQWPPPEGVGNYWSEEIQPLIKAGKILEADGKDLSGYRDGFGTCAPVGSFPADRFGLHDLDGNVSEWCSDLFEAGNTERVLRGGAWNVRARLALLSSTRRPAEPDKRFYAFGFRVVLAADASAAPAK